MIANNPSNNSSSALDAIKNSPIEFYLTGSRFFGTATEDSDWDFFVIESFLWTHEEMFVNLGFRPIQGMGRYPGQDYLQDLHTIWEHPTEHIHIQFVYNPQKKDKIQNGLKRLEVFRNAPKDPFTIRSIWQAAYSGYKVGRQSRT